MLRNASHSGSWYSAHPSELNSNLTKFLNAATSNADSSLRILIAPHAGLTYSGPTAGFAYKSIINYRRVFLLGPSHHVYFRGCKLTPFKLYETPLGNIEIDQRIVGKLMQSQLFEMMDYETDLAEHSLEMHLPFLSKVLPNVQLVPILVGSPSNNQYNEIAELLAEYLRDPESLFIVSTDFCHWGNRFNYQPTNNDMMIYEHIQNLDKEAIESICHLSYDGFKKYLQETGNTICGRNPILLALKMLEKIGVDKFNTELLDYRQSSAVLKETDSSVSYAALKICIK